MTSKKEKGGIEAAQQSYALIRADP